MNISFASAIFWIAALCFIVAEVAIVRSAITARGAPPATGTLPPAHYGEDIVWAVLPAVALAVVLLFTWNAIQNHERGSLSRAPIVSSALRSPLPVPCLLL